MYRRSDDAIITDDTPAETRLLFPYVIGLSGEFNNTSVALAATNLFTVRFYNCFCYACIACESALLLCAVWHAICTARVHDMHVFSQAYHPCEQLHHTSVAASFTLRISCMSPQPPLDQLC